jgi:hypothetical protein
MYYTILKTIYYTKNVGAITEVWHNEMETIIIYISMVNLSLYSVWLPQ